MIDMNVRFNPVHIGRPPQSLGKGKILRFRFENGLGASVVTHEHSYGGVDEWELAVIEYSTGGLHDDGEWDITYDTPITNDVIGYLTWDQVEELLGRIESL